MSFQVIDNGTPADCFHHPVHKSWDKSKFVSLAEAQDYLRNWFGAFCPDRGTQNFQLPINTPYNYNGYGDYVEIREIRE